MIKLTLPEAAHKATKVGGSGEVCSALLNTFQLALKQVKQTEG